MAFDINNQYTGKLFGQDRIGHTTPDLELSDPLRPWIPVPYPAPYLPALRQDQGHPKLASVVLSSHALVGLDKSGAIVPAGLFCGKTPAGSNQWCIVQYTSTSADQFTIDPRTGTNITPGTHVVFAAPADANPGNVTLTNGSIVTVTWADLNWAWSCNLFPSLTAGSTASTTTTRVPVSPVIVASTSAAPSTATWTLGGTTDTVYGQISFSLGVSGTVVTANLGSSTGEGNSTGATLANAVIAINNALSAASISTMHASTGSGTLIITGTVDTSAPANGTYTLAVTSDVDDLGTASTLIPYSYGVVRPVGVAIRNTFQYVGGVVVLDKSLNGGILYRLEGLVPTGFQVNNYMHEMGTAIQTQFVLRVPWIGATPNTLQTDANTDGIQGYYQSEGRTYTHYTGNPQPGAGVTFSIQQGDAGNYSDFSATTNSPVDLIGRIIGVMNMIHKVGYSNRIKTLWDPARMVGPMTDPNPASIMMGGSATGGLPYDLNLTTDGIYKASLIQGTQARAEYGTYVLVRVNL
jgi:hypothetical protein